MRKKELLMCAKELKMAYDSHLRIVGVEAALSTTLCVLFVLLAVFDLCSIGDAYRPYLWWSVITWCIWVFSDKFVFVSLKKKAKDRVQQLEQAYEREKRERRMT